MCVASRLLKKSNKNHEITSDIASKWLEKCGGDLVVFAISFDPSSPDKLNRSYISEQVRQRYIVPAEKQGGKGLFLELCVLSAIDLASEDQAIWHGSAESLFPEFIENGTILRITRGEGNPRQYCRLFHPSLGAVILRVLTNFNNYRYEKNVVRICDKGMPTTSLYLFIDPLQTSNRQLCECSGSSKMVYCNRM